MWRMLLLTALAVIFGCEAQDAPPEPKSAKTSMVEQSYDSNNALRDYEAILAAKQQPEPPPTPPPKPKETVKSLTDKLKRMVLEHPDKIRQHWEKTSGSGSVPPKPPQGLHKDDWVKWYKETKKWAQANKEAFKKWVKGLVGSATEQQPVSSSGKPAVSRFMDAAASLLRGKPDITALQQLLNKYDAEIQKMYQDDISQFPEIKETADKWMRGYNFFKQAVEAGDAEKARKRLTSLMSGMLWMQWNRMRRMLRGE